MRGGVNSLYKNINIQYKLLKDISSIKRGERITKRDLNDNGKYIAISGGENIFGRINKYNRDENTITIAQYGSAGYVNWQKEKFWANDVCYSVFPNEEFVNKRFLYYVLINLQEYIYTLTTKSIPDHLPFKSLENIQIPIPSLEVQNKIVEILDNFSSLVDDISNGIPKEIELRTKQHEYYRDKLLTFNE